ncbi:M42 family peptidase, partial [candidate division KSB3 bacterium]|nr:M42 family peptidase [candidate division KSB3 bacterium]MBD3325183.1 M42 family peptidase [candidate division KSB3 bacterium]
MNDHAVHFLKQLLNIPSPSGDEAAASRCWRQEAETFADDVRADVRGNAFAVLNGKAPRVLLAGHIDEIGVMISYIDDDGFLSFAGIGGWDPQVLVGQRVCLLGRTGEVSGVIGRKPIHSLEEDERKKASQIKELWIDIGAKNRDEAAERVSVGSVGVLEAPIRDLPNGRLVARGIDDRIGAFVV